MKSSLHSLILFLPLLNHSTAVSRHSLNSQLFQLAWGSRYIASGRPQQKTPLPKNFSMVIYVCLPRRCIETAVLILLRVFISAGTCIPNRCLGMNVYSGSAIPAFRRHVRILWGVDIWRDDPHCSLCINVYCRCAEDTDEPWLKVNSIAPTILCL
jgi:hypothetical protein